MQGAVQEWEVKIKSLKLEHDIEIDALFMSMLPADFQDYVCQWSDGKVQ